MTRWDLLPKVYKPLELITFGPLLHRARTASINDLVGTQNVLILGEGDGRFLRQALDTAPDARFTIVDGSEGMLNVARKRIGAEASRVEFHQLKLPREFSQLTHTAPFDAIVTHFFLDCFCDDELVDLIPAVTSLATSSARWLISDFHIPAKGRFKHLIARSIVSSLYFTFRGIAGLGASKLPEWISIMSEAGWEWERTHPKHPFFLISQSWRRQQVVERPA